MNFASAEPSAAQSAAGKGVFRILGDAFNRYVMEGGMTHGAALTYYAVFSIGPLLLIATAIAGWFFGEAEAEGELREKLIGAFGPGTARTIGGLLAGVRVAGLFLILSLIATKVLAAMKKYVPDELTYSSTFLLSLEFLITLVMASVVCAPISKLLTDGKVVWLHLLLGACFNEGFSRACMAAEAAHGKV